MRVVIILVNWNGWRDTVECLDSLLLLNYPDFRIVVCDNGSSDESLQQIRNWAHRRDVSFAEYQRTQAEKGGSPSADSLLTLVLNGENMGFAGGNNVGLHYVLARGEADYCWLLNNDTVVDPDALSHLVNRMKHQPLIGICGSSILLYHDRRRIQALGGGHYYHWIGIPWHYGRFSRWGGTVDLQRAESRINYVEGASMLVSRQFLDKVGLLCEDYFLYFEEADWAIRAKGCFKLSYAPESIVYHKVGGSIGTCSNPLMKSYLCDYFNIRNRILFTRRYYPAALPSVYLVLIGELLVRLLIGRWDRSVMIIRLMLGLSDSRCEDVCCRVKS